MLHFIHHILTTLGSCKNLVDYKNQQKAISHIPTDNRRIETLFLSDCINMCNIIS